MKKAFLPKDDASRALWLQNFSAKLPIYATKYNVRAADITDLQQAAVLFSYILDYRNKLENHLKKLVQYKNDMADGISTNYNEIIPALPVFAATPTLVPKGIFQRAGLI